MTELIVALDGPIPESLVARLIEHTHVRWFKIGPQTLVWPDDWKRLLRAAERSELYLFLDLKLADTEDTVREAVKRFADAGIAAVSTFTNRATVAAMAGATGSDLRVWRVLRLTDSHDPMPGKGCRIGDGVICSPHDLQSDVTFSSDIDKVCPGVRMLGDLRTSGHREPATPQAAVKAGATHIVVGRPIWQAADPVAAAKEFLAALG